MLDTETKRRIDSARDILVGRIPDPKAQVEQITIALIYKFMDDMDKEAIEFGGNASFFTGEYEKYGWSKIFDPKLSGFGMLALYSDAILKLNQNPNIPQLFRDIFKNAYLPYRDPETLKLFLKTINEFHYDHSEKLGDAFEYLLSVLGSQGDAGQFRTPRHIIDFIVSILQPKKNETILDPACGTAGFLISSYKHILKENTNKTKGDLLTPDDRKKIMQQFTGYDISPDMVRLSLVNMYLHNFTLPKIYEYDTLTSEDRWGDYFDIIMANPPFMSPTGGIKPHKRFTIQAKRSEALFVDYIAEHINPTTGRAGIIVPEGVIFKSETAFKSLRKMLVDKNYLYAVVSLPAGIFNPYSGVKTSILLLDKTVAKKTKSILFVKIENDGFDLGAQRKAIAKNDLTDALEVINNYQLKIKNDEAVDVLSGNCLLVDKEKIKANADYNLSMERFKVNANLKTSHEMIKLGDVLDYEQPTAYIVESENYDDDYKTPVLTAGKTFILGYTNEVNGIFNEDLPVIIFDDFTTATKLVDFPFKVKSSAMKILKVKKEKADLKFLYYIMQKVEFNSSDHKRYWISQYSQIQIPLPPLSIQQEIVNKIDGWQKIIDGAKQVIENYKPQIDINPDWEMVTLENVCNKITDGSHFSPPTTDNGYPYVTVRDIIGDCIDFSNCKFIDETYYKELLKNDCNPLKNDILFSKDGTVGKVSLVNFNKQFVVLSSLAIIRPNAVLVNPAYLKYVLQSEYFLNQAIENKTGVAIKRIVLKTLKTIPIPFPPIFIQQQIVNHIEQEKQLINANKQLIQIFEQKIKDEINKLWQTEPKEYVIEDAPLSLVAEEELKSTI